MLSVLLIEDDPEWTEVLQTMLSREGHAITHAGSAEEALTLLRGQVFELALVDLKLPGMGGAELIETLRGDGPPMVVVTGNRDLETAIHAMRVGATDYLTKPVSRSALQLVLDRAMETARLRHRVDRLEREALDAVGDPDPGATATSGVMREALRLVERAALGGSSSVLFVGESGAGKEVLAAHLHRCGPRAGPFVRINVAAIPDTMMEAELFGSTRGAFTDARRDRRGFFAAAEGGTLLLDEIAEMRPELQAKLLRVIETRRYYPVGASRESLADVRIIAATNREPTQAVAEGRLRADLFYRLSSMLVRVPPLRERREDIPLLAKHLLDVTRRQLRRGPRAFDADAIDALQRCPWPGNVRELRNAVERLAILCDGPSVTRDDLARCAILADTAPPRTDASEPPAHDEQGALAPLEVVTRRAVAQAERAHLAAVLRACDGNRSRAAAVLKISRTTLWNKLQRYDID